MRFTSLYFNRTNWSEVDFMDQAAIEVHLPKTDNEKKATAVHMSTIFP